MLKRVTWFVGGAVAGAAGAGVAKRKVKATAAALAPRNVAKQTGQRIRDAVDEGRRAARVKEAELRARLDGRHATIDQVADVDQVLIDGREVEPGRVIVLQQVAERRSRRQARNG
jgi:hypothetical protein